MSVHSSTRKTWKIQSSHGIENRLERWTIKETKHGITKTCHSVRPFPALVPTRMERKVKKSNYILGPVGQHFCRNLTSTSIKKKNRKLLMIPSVSFRSIIHTKQTNLQSNDSKHNRHRIKQTGHRNNRKDQHSYPIKR